MNGISDEDSKFTSWSAFILGDICQTYAFAESRGEGATRHFSQGCFINDNMAVFSGDTAVKHFKGDEPASKLTCGAMKESLFTDKIGLFQFDKFAKPSLKRSGEVV